MNSSTVGISVFLRPPPHLTPPHSTSPHLQSHPRKTLSHPTQDRRAGGAQPHPPPPSPLARSESRDNFVGYKSSAPREFGRRRLAVSRLCVGDLLLESGERPASRSFLPQAGSGPAGTATSRSGRARPGSGSAGALLVLFTWPLVPGPVGTRS